VKDVRENKFQEAVE